MTPRERQVLDWTEVDAAIGRAHELRAAAFHNAFAITWRWLKDRAGVIRGDARPCPSC